MCHIFIHSSVDGHLSISYAFNFISKKMFIIFSHELLNICILPPFLLLLLSLFFLDLYCLGVVYFISLSKNTNLTLSFPYVNFFLNSETSVLIFIILLFLFFYSFLLLKYFLGWILRSLIFSLLSFIT